MSALQLRGLKIAQQFKRNTNETELPREKIGTAEVLTVHNICKMLSSCMNLTLPDHTLVASVLHTGVPLCPEAFRRQLQQQDEAFRVLIVRVDRLQIIVQSG